MTLVIVQDLRTARICLRGARPWFARHGIGWSEFVTSGVPAEALLATGDELARRVVSVARAREQEAAGNGR